MCTVCRSSSAGLGEGHGPCTHGLCTAIGVGAASAVGGGADAVALRHTQYAWQTLRHACGRTNRIRLCALPGTWDTADSPATDFVPTTSTPTRALAIFTALTPRTHATRFCMHAHTNTHAHAHKGRRAQLLSCLVRGRAVTATIHCHHRLRAALPAAASPVCRRPAVPPPRRSRQQPPMRAPAPKTQIHFPRPRPRCRAPVLLGCPGRSSTMTLLHRRLPQALHPPRPRGCCRRGGAGRRIVPRCPPGACDRGPAQVPAPAAAPTPRPTPAWRCRCRRPCLQPPPRRQRRPTLSAGSKPRPRPPGRGEAPGRCCGRLAPSPG